MGWVCPAMERWGLVRIVTRATQPPDGKPGKALPRLILVSFIDVRQSTAGDRAGVIT